LLYVLTGGGKVFNHIALLLFKNSVVEIGSDKGTWVKIATPLLKSLQNL